MWEWKDRVLSRTTPRLLTCVEGETVKLSMVTEGLSVLESVDFEPMRRTSVLSLFSFRKYFSGRLWR